MNLALILDVAAGGLLLGGLDALIAVGLTLQYGLLRGLIVAHGVFLMLGGYLTYLLHVNAGMDPLVSLAAFLSGGCFGFYAAWRGYAVRRAQIHQLPQKKRKPSEVKRWAA